MAILTVAVTHYEHHELQPSDSGQTIGDVINGFLANYTDPISKLTLTFDENEIPRQFLHQGTAIVEQNDMVTRGAKPRTK